MAPPSKLRPGEYVRIIIKDTGIGIPVQYHSKIFDPFFTTKQKGSGLGLSIAYSIMRRHNGLITIESEADTRDCIYIVSPPPQVKNLYTPIPGLLKNAAAKAEYC